jgi:phosphogluconate dehydratase
MSLLPRVAAVTDRIRERSVGTRLDYLRDVELASSNGPMRKALGCTNVAHGFAAAPAGDKIWLREYQRPNVAIVSAYNDMLSAHQPFERFPALIKQAARDAGATAQFAGGVPAMCDGITQGEPGMELSLFSRDVIAMSTAIALSHNMFDAALCLGICDKIVPGLLIGALQFGHLPTIFVPGGPMPSGVSNDEKARVRQRFAKGEVGREALLESEEKSYHSPGTCTFFGTANSNQMLMEVMGLHMPGAAFVNPNTPLRDALTAAATTRAVAITALGTEYTPIGHIVDERAVVNAVVGLLATGGSTNHTIHLVAIARAAGIIIHWGDFRDLSEVVPLIARVYPNGKADVNQFHAAGGMGYVIGELLDAGLLHGDVRTVAGEGGLHRYRQAPHLRVDGSVEWRDTPRPSGDSTVLATAAAPFSTDGGLKLLTGNLGRSIVKTSAVKSEHRVVRAPALVFDTQESVMAAFDRGELARDFVAVVRFQGPRANGMPELHKLTPLLSVLQDQGFRVALVTDGRMSGASGKVLAAIHVTPECLADGPLARVQDGDVILLDAERGVLEVEVPVHEWDTRRMVMPDLRGNHRTVGRALFASFRAHALGAEQGAITFNAPESSGTSSPPGDTPLPGSLAATSVGALVPATPLSSATQHAVAGARGGQS